MYNYKASQAARRGKASRNNGEHSDNLKAFKETVWTVVIMAVMAILISIFASCGLIDAPIPTDWKHNDPEPVEVDTTDTDTILPVEIDTCEDLIEYTDPSFVTLYMKFDEPQDSVLWEGGGIQSYDLLTVVQAVTNLSAKVSTSQIGASVILKGTNNHSQFQLKIFTRIDGAKWYMGTAKQALILPGSDASYFKAAIHEYPSFNQWSFYGVDATCEEATAICRLVLDECRAGRWYADLFYMPCDAPQSVVDSLELYGWERIRE